MCGRRPFRVCSLIQLTGTERKRCDFLRRQEPRFGHVLALPLEAVASPVRAWLIS